MARFGLTIQKKFLLILMMVGLAPALVGVAAATWGGRLAFERATGTSLQNEAGQIASSVGVLGEEIYLSLVRIVRSGRRDLDSIERDARPILNFAAIACFEPGGAFNVRAPSPAIAEAVEARREFFAGQFENPAITEVGYLADLRLAGAGGLAQPRYSVYSFREPEGALVFFLASGDEVMRRVRSSIGPDADLVHLYSRNGYLMTTGPAPRGLIERAREELGDNLGALPGWFSVRRRESGRLHWHVVGYAVIPRLLQASAEGRVSTAWIVMKTYDMENFMGPQAILVWATVFVALGWALALVGISIFATRRIVGPVKSLRYQAEAMAAGNLEARASVRTHDEIHDLADAFNTMAAELRESHRALEARAEENRLRAEHIHVINEITKSITQALDLDRTFEILQRDLKGALDYDGLWIALTDRESGKLTVTHAAPGTLLKPLGQGEAPLEFSFHGRALREGTPAHGEIEALDESDGFESGVYAGLGFASYLVAPLPSVRRMLGTVTVVSRRHDAYGEEESKILASVAGSVALGIELTELFERAKSFASEMEETVQERTQELNRAHKKLMQTEKYSATGRLAANLAHEINNPLGIIKNYLKLVTDTVAKAVGGRRSSDPNVNHLGIINEEIDRIARIVRQLLDLHRPPEQDVKRTDLGAMLSDIIALMVTDLEAGGVRVVCELQRDLPKPMVAPDLVRQVFINLIRNSQDAMEKGGKLTIRAESALQGDGMEFQRVAQITIVDTGTGIAQADMKHIFDPFFTTKAQDKGTGLGLSVSYGIIQMYGGSIEAFSEPGKGTTMVVSIPVDQPTAQEEADEKRIPPQKRAKARGVEDIGSKADLASPTGKSAEHA